MVRLREIPRNAAFAWSPDSGKPLVATGTRAGAIDADFSNESKLELWDLNIDGEETELEPVASITTNSSFYDIAWGPADEDHPRGIVAGGFEDGTLELWDAEQLLSGSSASLGRVTKHSGPIKALQFNPLKPNILATAGPKSELYVYDVNDVSNAFRLGTPVTGRPDDLECLAWNRKVSHILATGGSGGYITVWDLKTKKHSLAPLSNQRKAVSAIAWDPNNSTKLLTATPDDSSPVIFLWDLRKSGAPEKVLQGHEQGVLSLSWCQQDSDLLLSSGKDNKTIVWNPQTGEKYGEFPEVTNWTFSTKFNPHNPNILATAAFDGRIRIQTLQNTNPTTPQAAAQNNLDGEDFFASAQTQAPQDASFSLSKAPKWMARPVGASFGFGGNLVIVKPAGAAAGKPSSKTTIARVLLDAELDSATQKFEERLASGDMTTICESRAEQVSEEDEKADWHVMKMLASDDSRRRIVEEFGFKQKDTTNGVATEGEKTADESTETGEKDLESDMFSADAEDEGEDFFTKPASAEDPFHLVQDGDDGVDAAITKAIMVGDFAKAAEVCLKEDRMADAFLIANCGGQELVDKVQSAYVSRQKGSPSYIRLLGSIIGKNLWDVVRNADLSNWKETLAVLCTFSSPEDFPDLCESLGDRLMEQGERKDASFCYQVGAKLEKVVPIWTEALEEAEKAAVKETTKDTFFSVHAKMLQDFVEKVTVFRCVTKFEDPEKDAKSGWKLAPLYDRYLEYADIMSANGRLDVAQKYLELLPAEYSPAKDARDRVQLATKKVSAQPATRQAAVPGRSSSRMQPMVGYQPPQTGRTSSPANNFAAPAVGPPSASTTNPYAPPSTTAYAPPTSTSPYAPTQGYQPPAQSGYTGQPLGYQPPTVAAQTPYSSSTGYGPPPSSFGAPPRNTTPSIPPPSKAKNMENWNDVPLVTKSQPARRSTPGAAPITSPFPNHGIPPGPPQSPYGRTGATPPPPPPKGPAPPRVSSPLAGPPPGSQPPRPPSTAASAYAPPPPQQPAQSGVAPSPMQQTVPRVASPYSAPPTGPPPSNRYAPSPAAQPSTQPGAPPPGSLPPPSNPYGAPPPQQGPPKSSYAPSPYQAAPQQSKPPTGPPPMGPPPAAQGQALPPPPRATGPPPRAKPASSDGSQAPGGGNVGRIIDILTRDMQRVSSRAPPKFTREVEDTQKRLNLLFDHLNKRELVQDGTVGELAQLAQAIETRDYEQAAAIQANIQTHKAPECGNWMAGVKRLIKMSKNIPA